MSPEKPRETQIVRLNEFGRELVSAGKSRSPENPDRVGVVRNGRGNNRNCVMVEWDGTGELESWNVFYLDWAK